MATSGWQGSLLRSAGLGRVLGSIGTIRVFGGDRVSILAYHRVCDDPDSALAEYAISPSVLRRQLQILDWLGYRAVTLRALLDAFDSGLPVGRTVVLTFDDGYLDTIEAAAPLLEAAGAPATAFVVPAYVGGAAAWDAEYGGNPAPLASWSQIRALRERGWEIGLHSATHPNLTMLSDQELTAEIAEGKAALERELGAKVEAFAYPFGRHSDQVTTAANSAGLRAAVAVESRRARPGDSRYALPRYTVHRSDSLLDFVLTVTIGRPLYLWRVTRRMRRARSKIASTIHVIGRRPAGWRP